MAMAKTATDPNAGYNINPVSQGGTGTFGQVPGTIGLPPVAAQLQAQLPGLSNLNSSAASDIQSNLNGALSPGTSAALDNAAATYGTASGMPGSGLDWNSLYGNIAGASTAQQNQGISQYDQLVPTVSGTQTLSPQLQTQVAFQNAVDSASPNPVDAGLLSTAETIGSTVAGTY